MPGRKRTEEEIAERAIIAKEFRDFRTDFLFSQKKLADTLGHGACRRTIQMVEAGRVNVNLETLKRFRDLVRKHNVNKGR